MTLRPDLRRVLVAEIASQGLLAVILWFVLTQALRFEFSTAMRAMVGWLLVVAVFATRAVLRATVEFDSEVLASDALRGPAQGRSGSLIGTPEPDQAERLVTQSIIARFFSGTSIRTTSGRIRVNSLWYDPREWNEFLGWLRSQENISGRSPDELGSKE